LVLYYLRYKYGRILYDTAQDAGNWQHIVAKAAAFLFIGGGLLHFGENPVGISIYIVPLLLLVLFFNHEALILFEDRLVYVPSFSAPWKKQYKEFLYKDLHSTTNPVHYEVQGLPKGKAILNETDPRRKLHILFNDNTSDLYYISSSIPWHLVATVSKLVNKEVEKYKAYSEA
jgi:hypothetical protein